MLTKDRLIRLCRARDRLREVGHDEMSIDAIAKEAALSRFHFIRQFKAVFGVSPSQCRSKARLDEARHLLVHDQRSVTEICMDIGFSSLGSFSTLFTNRFGQSPSSYRARYAPAAEQAPASCVALLQRSWNDKSQISRSRTEEDQ